MSRNAEYQFFPAEAEELEGELIQKYEEICGVTLTPGSPEYLMVKWVAAIHLQERARENYAINQNIPSRAEGKNLDALAELFFARERTEAKRAECKVRFTISEAQSSKVKIPLGTRVTDEEKSLYWETEEETEIPAGETTVTAKVVCQSAGRVGNGWLPGQIKRAVDIFDYYAACENITTSDGGTDEMSDDELYEAMRLSMDALSTAGAMGSYIYHAKAVSTEIEDVTVASPEPGKVRIFALLKGGIIPGEEMKRLILEACNADTVRPLTDYVTVEEPEKVEYDIDLTYYTSDGEDVGEAVKEAVEEYIRWQGGKLGRDINPSRLIQMVMSAGVKRVEVRSPVFTVLQSGGKTAIPQVAISGEISILNGGVEDD